MRWIAFCILAVAMQPALAASLGFSEAKALADRDEASIHGARAQTLLESQGKAISQILPQCLSGARSNDLPPFVVVAKLDSKGKVVATWRDGDSDLAVCFEEKVAHLVLFQPPSAPFFTSFEMDLHAMPGQ
ncbi:MULTISPECIES: hypothetical protein [unclassified Rhodanobacter]|jgi:hypothetical protein|uniref:Uncharacterized protein n=1 Tax=Rhodanobacter humi TaxID=1888173 RepID=A0ABV4AP75_9GAMM